MSFNGENPDHLVELKAEIIGDPIGQDYAAADDVTKDILGKLNDPAQNVGADIVNRPTEDLDIPDIAAVIDEGEYAALSAYDQEWVKMFINRPAEVKLKPYQAKFLALFGSGSATLTATLALRPKPGSRAEKLWGVNSFITRANLIAARHI